MLPLLIRRPLEGANGRNWPGVAVVGPGAPQPAAGSSATAPGSKT